MKTSDVNPIDFDYEHIIEWAEQYVKEQSEWGGILKEPSPVLLTTMYAKLVAEKAILASKEVVLAAKRHLKDLKRSEDDDFPWKFDEEKAFRPIRFIEKKCKPSKGADTQLVMQPWQHFVIGSVFGWVNKKTGLRRYREALIFVGRKNGKTTMESGLADYMAGFDGENGPNVYILANSQKQSRILYEESKRMIEKSPWLKERFVPNVSEIRYPKTNGTIVAMSAEKSNKDGENLSFGVFDEIHEYQDYALINVMKRSRGMRKQPLIMYITTAGNILDGPLADYIDQAEDTLTNYSDFVNERTFYFVAKLDDPKEADDPRLWIKANPNFGLMQIADLISDYKSDRKSPKEYADWITKQFNIFAETDELSFITPETLALNDRVIDIDSLEMRDCIGGYDLSDTEDFTSACLEFPLDDGSIYVLEKSWIPQKRYERDKNPERIKEWEDSGDIEIIPGNYVDYSYVLEWFKAMSDRFNIVQVNYDPAKALRLNKEMEEAGFETNVVRQGFLTLGGPLQNFKELLLDGKVVFNNQKIFKWYLNNVRLRQDRNDNWLPTKQSQSRKIDGFAAALDAHTTVIDMLVEPDTGFESPEYISFKKI
ncbi:terminase large subunit [Secundilactobacillus pentosiphilus]|nr:terminase large subunit [Secundilactobacillus pentosiphilus]